MKLMTKAEIQKRHNEILVEMDNLEEGANREERAFTPEEARKYDALMREDNRLHTMIQDMLTERELEKFKEQKSKSAQLREFLANCVKTRSNDSTILMNAVTTGDDQNTTANLEASGAIPLTIKQIIDTKVPGIDLPEDLRMVTGVIGNEIWPYSTNDVNFTVNGEVEQVTEQALNFAKVNAVPARVAASVAVSHRAIDNAAFDLYSFITYKMQKGFAIFKALHVYSHAAFSSLKSPFAEVTVETLPLDENIGKNLATKVAEMYDNGFEGIPVFTMDKVTEVNLAYTKAIPGQTGDRTVVQDGRCVGYPYTVSPYIDYTLNGEGVPVKDTDRYIGIGHYGYLALQQHGEMRFNVDAQSSANFDRGTIVISMSTDLSMTELSSKVNGNANGKPQAFKLIKLVESSTADDNV